MKSKVAIPGIAASFHHEVFCQYFQNEAKALFTPGFSSAFHQLDQGLADYAIIAVENSIAGRIEENQSLIKNGRYKVLDEFILAIELDLMGLPGSNIMQATEVHSHYMALKQCADFLQQFPHLKQVPLADTASCAKQVVKQGKTQNLVVASPRCALYYGLETLYHGIEQGRSSETRFCILALKDKNREILATNAFNEKNMHLHLIP